jgi:hypothetical protein
MAELTTTEARDTWESAAPGWAKWEEVLARGFRDATETYRDTLRWMYEAGHLNANQVGRIAE